MISVIVPIYNAQACLRRCIDSILVTESPSMEVLLIDDGSTDGSSDICDEYAQRDGRVRVWHKINGGVSSARNLGIRETRGEWMVFVDADDAVTFPFMSYIPDNANDLICFNWLYSSGKCEQENLYSSVLEGERLKDFLNNHLVDYVFRTPWAKFFKSEIIKKNNIIFDERFKIGEDNLFVLEYLAHCTRIGCVADVGYLYTRPEEKKYLISVEKAGDYMTTFMSRYKNLNANCYKLLLLLELYYFMALGNDSFVMRMRWESIPAVRELQNRCMPYYGKRVCASIYLRRFLLRWKGAIK